MNLVTVIPISKGYLKENLTYFTKKDILLGSLVQVPIRKKITPAIVIACENVLKAKTALRQSPFALKKIEETGAPFLFPQFIKAVKEISLYFSASQGVVLKQMIPQFILDFDNHHNRPQGSIMAESTRRVDYLNNSSYSEISVFHGAKEDRIKHYKSVVREEFAKGKSVFILLPSIADIESYSLKLQKGIETRTIVLHSKIVKKKLLELWKQALAFSQPILIIGTPLYLSLPRTDLSTIIIDEAASSLYKSVQRPYLDFRKVVEILSKEMKLKLIVGGAVIRIEDYFNFSNQIPPGRLFSEARGTIISSDKKEEDFKIIGQNLYGEIKKVLGKNGQMLLFVNRRGHSPITVCNDCGRTALCGNCDSPLVLHHSAGSSASIGSQASTRQFICHKCKESMPAKDRCSYCKSWKLVSLGIGIEKTIEEIQTLFPKAKLFKMDSDSIKTKKQGEKLASDFLSTLGSILIGTEIIFSYFREPMQLVGVVSVDALFAIPDFRINERIFYLLIRLRSLAEKTFLIQTRLPECELFKNVLKGNVLSFYEQELKMRKMLGYPPFKTLIKISIQNKNKGVIKKEIKKLEEILKDYNPIVYPAFIPKIKGLYTMHALLKLDPKKWPDKRLSEILKSLSPAWLIDVDPLSLL